MILTDVHHLSFSAGPVRLDLQLLGGVWILQTFPAVIFGLYRAGSGQDGFCPAGRQVFRLARGSCGRIILSLCGRFILAWQG
jgi:hypothetical protein